MKSFVIVALILVALYVFFAKRTASEHSQAPAVATQVASPSPGAPADQAQGTNVLKRPIDRTREVLGEVRKNQESNQF